MTLIELRKQSLRAIRLTLAGVEGVLDAMTGEEDDWADYIVCRDVLKKQIAKTERMIRENVA